VSALPVAPEFSNPQGWKGAHYRRKQPAWDHDNPGTRYEGGTAAEHGVADRHPIRAQARDWEISHLSRDRCVAESEEGFLKSGLSRCGSAILQSRFGWLQDNRCVPIGEGQAAPQAIKVGKELRFNPGKASSCFLRASRDWLRCIPIDQRSHHCPGLQILRA
jgi:hypothetical protein